MFIYIIDFVIDDYFCGCCFWQQILRYFVNDPNTLKAVMQ